MDRRFFNIIKAPVLTEKSYKITQLENKYTFEVRRDASKQEIKKVFSVLFAVEVASVNIINKKKKMKKVGRYQGFRGAKKYAIIQLAPGEKLNIYSDGKETKDTAKTTREKIEEKIFSIKDKKDSKKNSSESKTKKSNETVKKVKDTTSKVSSKNTKSAKPMVKKTVKDLKTVKKGGNK